MLKLESGLDYFTDDSGKRVCTGAKQGRPDNIPQPIRELPSAKLHMVRLKWVDGDYDQGGAYWGRGIGDSDIYCAYANLVNPTSGNFFPFLQIFVRAKSRKSAKAQVRGKLPNAKFFR
jgi:hypothetical protein